MFLEILQNSQENTSARVYFSIKLQANACNFIKKEALAQVLSCVFCENSKNTYSYRTPPVAVSGNLKLSGLTLFALKQYVQNFIFAIHLAKLG